MRESKKERIVITDKDKAASILSLDILKDAIGACDLYIGVIDENGRSSPSSSAVAAMNGLLQELLKSEPGVDDIIGGIEKLDIIPQDREFLKKFFMEHLIMDCIYKLRKKAGDGDDWYLSSVSDIKFKTQLFKTALTSLFPKFLNRHDAEHYTREVSEIDIGHQGNKSLHSQERTVIPARPVTSNKTPESKDGKPATTTDSKSFYEQYSNKGFDKKNLKHPSGDTWADLKSSATQNRELEIKSTRPTRFQELMIVLFKRIPVIEARISNPSSRQDFAKNEKKIEVLKELKDAYDKKDISTVLSILGDQKKMKRLTQSTSKGFFGIHGSVTTKKLLDKYQDAIEAERNKLQSVDKPLTSSSEGHEPKKPSKGP